MEQNKICKISGGIRFHRSNPLVFKVEYFLQRGWDRYQLHQQTNYFCCVLQYKIIHDMKGI